MVAVKIYQRPWEFNITEREIIDTAMGNVDVGPKIYKFLPTGKLEQARDQRTSCSDDFSHVNPLSSFWRI